MNIWQDFKEAFSRKNNELNQLILINIIVFLAVTLVTLFAKISGFEAQINHFFRFLHLPADLVKFLYQPWSLLTYMFIHGDIFHILFNMLFLYWFGLLISEFVGGSRVVNLYILGGITGGLLYMFLYNVVPYYHSKVMGSLLVGASGGIFAVVFGAATLLPDYEFRILFLGQVKIKYIALFYVMISFIQIGGINAGGNIAHIGGAAMGYGYIKSLQHGTDLGTWIQAILGFFKSIFKPQTKQVTSRRRFFSEATVKSTSTTANNAGSKASSNYVVGQDEIDAILDKISRSGYESLSKEEKQKLFKASQQDS